jgi:hypothetical protein
MTMHQMNIFDRTGHTQVSWDPDDKASVADASDKFTELVGKGYTAFAVDTKEEDGLTIESKGRRITTFDPKAGKVLMVPQLVGG